MTKKDIIKCILNNYIPQDFTRLDETIKTYKDLELALWRADDNIFENKIKSNLFCDLVAWNIQNF